MVVGVTALTIRPASSASAATGAASMPGRQLGPEQQAEAADADDLRAAPRARLVSRCAGARGPAGRVLALHDRRARPAAAAAASGWPPKVLPWSPGAMTAATSRRAQQAPMGTPLPSALASVTTSGCDAVVLEAEPTAGPAQPGLDLVDHEQQPALVAQPAHALEVGQRRPG